MSRRAGREAAEMGSFMRRVCRAMTRRAAEGDTDALVQLVRVRAELDAQIVEAGRALVAFGYSYGDIAGELRISRQAAFKRFAVVGEPGNDGEHNGVQARRVG